MADTPQTCNDAKPVRPGDWRAQVGAAWQSIPHKGLLLVLLGAWTALFHFIGNSTLGYVSTSSMFRWWWLLSTRDFRGGTWDLGRFLDSEEVFAFLAPLIVMALFWMKREEFLSLPKQAWWPALGLFIVALGLHLVGFMVQQARVSLMGFILGVYALTGLVWGRQWLRASFFPFLLLGFCLPLGNRADTVTFPLRLLATKISAVLCDYGLGINLIQEGTRLSDSTNSYQYEVAAACSGIRSLYAIVALAIVYGYLTFETAWRRWVMILAALPLAVAANVVRLTVIIIAAEAFGQHAGDSVHQSVWFSLVPYIPPILGVILLGHWMREDRKPALAAAPVAEPAP